MHCDIIRIMKFKKFLPSLAVLAVLMICLLAIGYIFKPRYHLPVRTQAGISQSGAQSIVEKISEVADYELLLKKNNKKASVVVEDDGDFWRVQVFEVVNDDGSTHTATFGWYSVNKKTGAVKNDME